MIWKEFMEISELGDHVVFVILLSIKITFKVCVRCTPLRKGKC